jgi:tetratricopeptide (TPR) repeat protein
MPTGIATAELIGDLSNVPAARVIPLMRQLVGRSLVREFVAYGQYAYYLHESIQTYVRNWLQQYQRLQITENRALQAVQSYVERHAHNNAADHDRLAAEIDNIVGAAAFATDTSQTNALRQLLNALTQQAGDFVTLRGFQPELGQVKKLATLLPDFATRSTGTHTATGSAEIVKKRTTGSLRPITSATPPPDALVSAASRTESSRIPEPPLDTQATPAIQRLPLVPKPPLPEESDDTVPGDQTQPAPSTPEILPGVQSLEQTIPNFSTESFPPVVVADTESDSPTLAPSPESSPTAQAVEATLLADRVDARSLVEAEVVIVEPPLSPEDTETPTDLSLPTVQKQLDDARAADDLDAQAPLLQTLGQFYADRGNRPEAMTHYKEALEIYEVIEDNDGMLATLDALAAITAQADDVENALVYATRGVNLAQQIGDQDRLGRLQTRLGDVRLALGDTQAAVETYTQAAETLRSIDNWAGVGTVMLKMGEAYLEKSQPQEAILMLDQALVIFRREGLSEYESRALGTLGDVYAEMSQWPKAQEYHEQALALARQLADPFEEAAQLAALAHIREIQNDRPAAVNFYRQALHVAYTTGDVDLQAENAFELGRLLIDDTRTLMQAAQLLRESDSLVPNSEARRLLSRASKRLERTTAAGITLPPVEGTNQEYAASGYAQTQGAMSGSSAPR